MASQQIIDELFPPHSPPSLPCLLIHRLKMIQNGRVREWAEDSEMRRELRVGRRKLQCTSGVEFPILVLIFVGHFLSTIALKADVKRGGGMRRENG